jgi:GT2 family glycosyltransferase
MKNKFAIGIPTLNRADLLIPSLERYSKDFEGIDILVIDNGCQKDLFDWISKSGNAHIQYVCNKVNIGVAGSWNCILHNLLNSHQYVLVLNDDVYLGKHKNEIDEIIDKSQSQLIVGEMFFSVFIISRNLFYRVGNFDDGFYPAYFEDSDYLYRLKLLDISVEVNSLLNPSIYRECQTYEKDNELVNKSRAINRERYIKKWGGLPLLEKYNTPYNE